MTGVTLVVDACEGDWSQSPQVLMADFYEGNRCNFRYWWLMPVGETGVISDAGG